jgi:hypothetical protein
MRRWLRSGRPTRIATPEPAFVGSPWNNVQGASVGSRWTNRLPIDLEDNVDIPLYRDGVDTQWGVAICAPGTKVVAANSLLVVTDRGWVEPTSNMRFYVILEVDDGPDQGLRFVVEYVADTDPEPMRLALGSIEPNDRP